jgi:hypothetical protein
VKEARMSILGLAFGEIYAADIFGTIFTWIFEKFVVGAYEQPIVALILLVMGWVVKQYLIPWLNTDQKRKYAELVCQLADEVTDDLVDQHPNEKWDDYLNDGVDKLMELLGIPKRIPEGPAGAKVKRKHEMASRAMRAAKARREHTTTWSPGPTGSG